MALVVGCSPSSAPPEAPLRPLLYTESPRGAAAVIPQYEEWMPRGGDPTEYPSEFATSAVTEAPMATGAPSLTPEALALDVFAALVSGDRERLLAHTFSAEQLAEASRMTPDGARREADAIVEATLATLAVFTTDAEQRRGLSSLLVPGQLEIGRPRRRDGRPAERDDAVVMHWGSSLTFTLRGTDVEFELRLPNLLVDESGEWRLRAAPTVSSSFVTYRAIGLDRLPELMDTDHAALPLAVGSYWQYSTRRPGLEPTAPGYTAPAREGYRDSVLEVSDHGTHRIVTFRRTFENPNESSQRFSYLVTPNRVYPCTSECVRRGSAVAWVLGYAERTTPLLVLPLTRGAGWGAGGLDRRDNSYRVQMEPQTVSVPAGIFDGAYEITRSTPQGRQSSFFSPSIGFVMYRTDATLQSRVDELVDFRILP
ncbi:MAG: hypothetical protein H6700_04200 [Myxococcales bacterium]|nr:hypothetical protein [Myxococcales bacterium]